MDFFDHSTAGSATIFCQVFDGSLYFRGDSSAGEAQIEFLSGSLSFVDNSTASNATIHIYDGIDVEFTGNSTAGSANIVASGAFVDFFASSSAGSATISATGPIFFGNSSSGGTAQIELLFSDSFLITTGELDISHDVTIGSLAGVQEALVGLGANNLTVGTNNLSTTFSGTVGGDNASSLAKVGSGTLTLEGRGDNDYLEDSVGLILISQAGPINLNFTGPRT
jgi:hypothetical protein